MAGCLKFWIKKKRNCTIRVAKTKVLISFDLRLCFRIGKKSGFLASWLILANKIIRFMKPSVKTVKITALKLLLLIETFW